MEVDSTDPREVATVRLSSKLVSVERFPFGLKKSAVVAYIEDFLGRKFGEVCCFRREETLEIEEDFLVVMV